MILRVWQCNLVGNEYHLAADPNTVCAGPAYEQLVLWSYVSIVMYGLGIPTIMGIVLITNRCAPWFVSRRCHYFLLASTGCHRCWVTVPPRHIIIADQRLRMKNLSDTLRTNPYYFLQKRFKRLYFKFMPERYYWYGCLLPPPALPLVSPVPVPLAWSAWMVSLTLPNLRGIPRPFRRSLVILMRKFVVVMIGGLVYGEPRFAAVFTTVSLFIAFVLQKAFDPYRVNTDPLAMLAANSGDTTLVDPNKKSSTRYVCRALPVAAERHPPTSTAGRFVVAVID